MAKPIIALLFIISSLFVATPNTYAQKHGPDAQKAWFQNICQGEEKVAQLHFYLQDQSSGPNATIYEVARASITSDSPTAFGVVRVVDVPMTAEPDINSEKVGKGQGVIISADLETTAVAMNINFFFTSGKYNGSTISIQGRNEVGNQQREFPVVGGTGVFRFARGYAIVSTYSSEDESGHAVVECTIYVTYVGESKHASAGNM